MKRASKRIVLTTENVNSHGFRVLTDGIDTSQFENNNPILLWMHNRAWGSKDNDILPLGNLIELKRENDPVLGKIITGLPVFDEKDAFAMRIYEKYENGTIRMGSVGLKAIGWSEEPEHLLPGQCGATLIKSLMEEFSLCDIGSNPNAVQVALYDDNHKLVTLSFEGENATIPPLKHPLIISEMEKIQLSAEKAASLLGLKPADTPAVYEAKIAEVVQLAAMQKTQVENLTQEKSVADAKILKLTKDLEDEKTVQLTAKIETLVQGAITARKITADEKESYVALAKTDFATVEKILGGKAETPTAEVLLAQQKNKVVDDYSGKTWDDLDRSGKLVQLKSTNMTLFSALYEAKFNKPYKV